MVENVFKDLIATYWLIGICYVKWHPGIQLSYLDEICGSKKSKFFNKQEASEQKTKLTF